MSDDVVRPRRRWLWAVALLVVFGLLAPPAAFLYVRGQGDRELAAVRAELDADFPDWRMPDLIAARNARLAAFKVNSADTVAAAIRVLPDGWDSPIAEVRWLSDNAPNRQPAADEVRLLRSASGKTAPARETAGSLRDQPDGGTPIIVPDYRAYMMNVNLTPVQERRALMAVFQLHSGLTALDGDPAGSVDAVRTGLNVARSVGDEPFLISQLVRMACIQVAAKAAERTLGLCEPADGLGELQAAFEREIGEQSMQHGLRGELASVDQIMTNLRAGTAAGGAAGLPSGMLLNPLWAHDHAATLRFMRVVVRDAGRPPHQRGEAAAAEQVLLADGRAQMGRLLAPAVSKVLEADTRNRAVVAVAAVGLVCERHRRDTGRWPTSLAELPKELLAAVPADPYDGQPLRYKRTADGAVVYSVGRNRIDDGGVPPPAGDGNGGDTVFRLYDPAARRLPALPPTPADQP